MATLLDDLIAIAKDLKVRTAAAGEALNLAQANYDRISGEYTDAIIAATQALNAEINS